MGFGTGKYAKLWKIENKGNYHVAEMSTSKKNRDSGEYETDWSNKFVRLVGTAHTQASGFSGDERVKIGACEVTNRYDKEKNVTYTNYVIFGFEDMNDTSTTAQSGSRSREAFMNIPDGLEDEGLPFN